MLLAQRDEVLMRIPANELVAARRLSLTEIRVYHRFPDFFLVGTDRKGSLRFAKAGLAAYVLDDQPWSEPYAVVAVHPGNNGERKYNGVNCRILFTSTDFDIIKAHPVVFQQLREAGLACVEIEQREIPVEATTTHLPSGLYSRPNDFITDVIANVSDSIIRYNIQELGNLGTRYWNNANRDSVARRVKARYEEFGISDVRLDSFQYSSTWQQNVVATIPGTITPTAELIVGGHHDDMPSSGLAPGADDNASGTSAAMEMARVLKLVNYQPSLTMRFMGYAAEEAGLVGSSRYAQAARNANRDIRVMQNYDMIANRWQAPTDNSVYIVWYTTSEAYRDLHALMMQMYTPLVPVSTTSYRSGSDSYSFWQQNYRTVFCIEKNFSPYYHTSNDQLQYLDMTYCANIVKSGLAMLLTLDMIPPSVAGLQVRDCGDGVSLYARWDSVSVPDWYRYKVYVGTSPGVYTSNTMVSTRWVRLNGLAAGTPYYIGVSIVDLAGQEGIITELSGIPGMIPQQPAGVVVEHYGQGARLAWRRNSEMDLQGYFIYRSLDTGRTFVRLNTAPSPDSLWIDTLGIAWPRAYFVTAVDSSLNESAHSDTVVLAGPVAVEEPCACALDFRLHQNYPNPFNPLTNIGFDVGSPSLVTLRVFDVLGREVATLVNEVKPVGRYQVVWNASDAASGVYYYRLETGRGVLIRSMLLLK